MPSALLIVDVFGLTPLNGQRVASLGGLFCPFGRGPNIFLHTLTFGQAFSIEEHAVTVRTVGSFLEQSDRRLVVLGHPLSLQIQYTQIYCGSDEPKLGSFFEISSGLLVVFRSSKMRTEQIHCSRFMHRCCFL